MRVSNGPYSLNENYTAGPVSRPPNRSVEKVRVVRGESAYETAIENGYVGTESQWLDSLRGAVHVHNQSTPASTWIIGHNMGRNPDVAVYDELGEMILVDVSSTTTTVTVTFSSPKAGQAVLS